MARKNRYAQIIEKLFSKHYKKGAKAFDFSRNEILDAAKQIGVGVPKSLGDLVYSFRYRTELPKSIVSKAPRGTLWVIRPAGAARYKFVAVRLSTIEASSQLAETKVPDSTPGVIESYSLSDEQALLAKLRYNRLIDIFTGLTCYSLQNHLRTQVKGMGQIETDEIYIALDKRGAHYIIPVQAKGSSDKLGIVQIEQDMAMCAAKFPDLQCRPIAAQFMADDLIALFEFEQSKDEIVITAEKHYRLVPPEEISREELIAYSRRQE
jgi:hypothetical protein